MMYLKEKLLVLKGTTKELVIRKYNVNKLRINGSLAIKTHRF